MTLHILPQKNQQVLTPKSLRNVSNPEANPDSFDVFWQFFKKKNQKLEIDDFFFVKMVDLTNVAISRKKSRFLVFFSRENDWVTKQKWDKQTIVILFYSFISSHFIQSNLCNEIQNFLLSTRFFISYKFVCFFIGILGSVE